ncbi:Phage capsid family protein [Clavibacter michiganensis subsp. michiganensis]|uniref:phage major capsid protein n=1 Tax=Clavibacter michiganensis TaxID=28447 RepID=UPI001302FF28|nr:hypothetical protein [Clavibacter michiganensis]KAF0258767.1 Phage capsid family protein [Clavibacter michiganensis subsp. michiganensis]
MTFEFQNAGDFAVNAEARTVRGLLLPWNELSRTSASDTPPIKFKRGSITVPQDVMVIGANRRHDRYDTVGRATKIEDTEQGLVAEFSIAKNPEGDEFLAEYKAGTLRKLSAEMKDIVRNGADAISARLTGAGFVPEGAFSSAALFALGDVEEETPEEETSKPTTTVEKHVEDFTDEQGVKHTKTTTVTTVTDGDTTTITTKEVITEPEAPEKTESEVTNPIPNAAAAAAAKPDAEKRDKNALFSMISTAVNAQKMGDATALMALADVKISGSNALGTGVVQPEWLGEVWSGRTQERKVIPLFGSTALTSLTTKGYRFKVKPQVSEWAGNKADIPTNTPTTENVEWALTRFAGGWDIAREFIDFGETAVIEAFLRLAADDYAMKSDAKVLADVLGAATKSAVGDVPSTTSDAMAKIVRGALRVVTANALPSFALVAPDVFEELMFTKETEKLAYLTVTAGLQEGALESFRVVPHAGIAAGNVLVGAKEAVTVAELGGSPIRVNAIDIARGGVDEALFGYVQTRIEYPTGLQLVTPNAA